MADIAKAVYPGRPVVNIDVMAQQAEALTGSLTASDFFAAAPTSAGIVKVEGAANEMMESVTAAEGKITYVSKANLQTTDETATYKAEEKIAYTDVSPYAWYAEAAAYVTEQGLMNGVGEGRFAPSATVTRAMVWTVLARMDGENTEGGSTWYSKARTWAMENGVSDGANPEAAITREQLATMLYRYCGSPAVSGSLSGYADGSSVSDWAEDAMLWAIEQGLIEGVGDNKLAPAADTTRAQLAQILMRFDKKF